MVQGFERRDVIEDANAKSRAVDPQTVPLSPVMRPQPSSFSRVGAAERQLAEILGKADLGLQKYVKKKSEEWRVEGAMQRAEGKTEREVAQKGNRFTQAGWQAMNGKIAGDSLFQQELEHISTKGREMDSKSYQQYLSDKFQELNSSLPADDSETRSMLNSYAMDMYPKLVSKQIQENNEYNRVQTKDSGRKMLVSTAETDGPEAVKELLDPDMYRLSKEDYDDMVTASLVDSYKIGSTNLERAFRETGAAKPGKATPEVIPNVLNLIGQAESRGSYTAVYGGENPKLTNMTLDEVLAMQGSTKSKGGKSTAVGKYQIINSTLTGLKEKLGLTGTEPFDENLQDTLATELLVQRGANDFLSGTLTAEQFQANIAQEWAAIPKDRSGLSHYDGDGLNKATVEPGQVLQALTGDSDTGTLYATLAERGVSSDGINKVLKARESYQTEQSSKFDATRLLAEQDIKAAAINLADKDLIQLIQDTKEANGYSEAWANSTWNSALSQRKADMVERKKLTKVQTLIATNSVQIGTREEQEKAIDLVTQQAFNSNPDALDPASPNHEQARKATMDQVYKFMYANQITDRRMSSAWEVATTGDIIDAEGKVKPAAIDAYTGYLQARNSVNDPAWAQTLLSDKTQDLFLMADSYRTTNDGSDAEQALATASSFLQKQNSKSGVNNLPWWKDASKSFSVRQKMVDKALPGLFSGYGLNRTQAQMRWSLNRDSVEKAAVSPGVTDRIKMEAAKMWNSLKHWDDGDAARELAMEKAANKVISKSEYVAGSFVYMGDQDKLSSRIGMGGINNAANMVTSRILKEFGPTIWKDYNKTDIYPMSQSWYEQEPGLEKAADFIASAVVDTVTRPGKIIGNVGSKLEEKVRGVPDFSVIMNPSGNALVIAPYENYERTRQGAPFILSVEKMREAAAYLNKGDEAGFKQWADEQRKTLPKY